MTFNNNHHDLYDKFIRENPLEAEKVRKLVQEGRNLYQARNLVEARNRFVKALSIYPYVPPALVNLASISIQNENLDQAWHYISTGLEYFPHQPAVHGVAISYWLKLQSSPYVQYHCFRAIETLEQIVATGVPEYETEVIDRARMIVHSTLVQAANDHLVVKCFELFPDADWNEYAVITTGIAYFNMGQFDKAQSLWQRVANEFSSAAYLYLYLLELMEQESVIPFRLDYELNAQMPVVDDLQYLSIEMREDEPKLQLVDKNFEDEAQQKANRKEETDIGSIKVVVPRELPALAIISGLHYIFEEESKKGEIALCILFFQRWPHLPRVLHKIIEERALATSLRLNAAFYLLSIEGADACQKALEYIERERTLTNLEQFMSAVIWLQLALHEKNGTLARERITQARLLASSLADLSWEHFLDQLEEQVNQIDSDTERKANQRYEQKETDQINNVISLLPRLMRKQEKSRDDS